MSNLVLQNRKRAGFFLTASGLVVLIALYTSNRDYFDSESSNNRTAKLIRASRRDLTKADRLISDKDLIVQWTKQRQDLHNQRSLATNWALSSKILTQLDREQLSKNRNYLTPYLNEALEQEHKSRAIILPGTAAGIATSLVGQFLVSSGFWSRFTPSVLAVLMLIPMCAVQVARKDLAIDVLNAYEEEDKRTKEQTQLLDENEIVVDRFG